MADDDREVVRRVAIGVGLYSDDYASANSLCKQLSTHSDEFIPGNAVLGLGHLARRSGSSDDEAVGIVAAGLHDPSQYVREQAWAAADDIESFVRVKVPGFTHA
ncbi:MAG TPA: hypothetical protein VHO06_26070 [Polyangia bacterium]|nr:hypothetical protein [Polyangia bacterium]